MARGGGGGGGASGWDGNWKGRILEIIYGHYKKALDALPLEHMPSLAPRLLHAGVCFGFADPVTNIIANTLLLDVQDGHPGPGPGPGPDPNLKRKRRSGRGDANSRAAARDEILSKMVAGDGPSPPEARTIAERSFYGLVAFLISYFRFLSTWDALRYLYLARADLLVAVHLIQRDRCCIRRKHQLRIRSHTVTAALRCAACSSRQPDIDAFLTGSFALVSHLSFITRKTLSVATLSVEDVCCLSGLLQKPLKLKKSDDKPMDFAAQRFHHLDMDASIDKVPAGRLNESLRSILLDRIHALYLKALSRLPMEDFRTRHHRALLKAGYCFGPLSLVSNIIVNTIWYDSVFPPSQNFEVDMIRNMRHVESRSLNGLLAFLRASLPDVSEHSAMIYLIKSNLNIRNVIKMATQEGHDTSSVCDDTAYKAALDVSYHPKPEEYLEFVMQTLPIVRSDVRSLLLQDSRILSSSNVVHLSTLLSHSIVKALKPPAVELTKDAMEMFSNYKEDFLTQQAFICKKVKSALWNYEQTTGYRYELCIICAVNDYVGKRRWIGKQNGQYSHVNFWASPDNGKSSTLFFAEFSNVEDSDQHHPFCYPVSDDSAQVRCCYCEYQGTRIVHPFENCWEGARDFEKIVCWEHKLTNPAIISSWKMNDNHPGLVTNDFIYLDVAWDVKLIQSMNHTARVMNLDVNEEMKRIKPMGVVG